MHMMQKLVAVVAVQAALGVSAPAAFAADEELTHTVESGQNLHMVAMRYGISWAELAELNGLENPDEIEEGVELILPQRLAGRVPVSRSRTVSTTPVQHCWNPSVWLCMPPTWPEFVSAIAQLL